jgi:hypothetical protein
MQGFIQWRGWGGSFPPKIPSFPPKRKERKKKKREKGERERERKGGRERDGGRREYMYIFFGDASKIIFKSTR